MAAVVPAKQEKGTTEIVYLQDPDLRYAVSDVQFVLNGGLFNPKCERDDLLADLSNLKIGEDDTREEIFVQYSRLSKALNVFQRYIGSLDPLVFKRILTSPVVDLKVHERKMQEMIPVFAEAFLQRNYKKRFYRSAFNDLLAFQEIVDSLYQRTVAGHSPIPTSPPPLAIWSKKKRSPYTVTEQRASSEIGLKLGVVCLPPEHRYGGILAWSAIGHEVAGHTFLQSCPGLIGELQLAVQFAVINMDIGQELKKVFSKYWSYERRTEELASDVLAVLNLGPSAAIGFIGHLRGAKIGPLSDTGPLSANPSEGKNTVVFSSPNLEGELVVKRVTKRVVFKEDRGKFGKLNGADLFYRRELYKTDPHPLSILRPYSMAAIVEALDVNDPEKIKAWNELIYREVQKDTSEGKVRLTRLSKDGEKEESREIDLATAIEVSREVAQCVAMRPFESLGRKSLYEIFSWKVADESSVLNILQKYSPDYVVRNVEGRHVVSASIILATRRNAEIEDIFNWMKKSLITCSTKTGK